MCLLNRFAHSAGPGSAENGASRRGKRIRANGQSGAERRRSRQRERTKPARTRKTTRHTRQKEHMINDGRKSKATYLNIAPRMNCWEGRNCYRFATPGGHPGLQGSRASNFPHSGFEAFKTQSEHEHASENEAFRRQSAHTSTQAKTHKNTTWNA